MIVVARTHILMTVQPKTSKMLLIQRHKGKALSPDDKGNGCQPPTEHIEEVTGQANGREKDASPHSSGIQKQQWPAMSQWKCACFKPQDYFLGRHGG